MDSLKNNLDWFSDNVKGITDYIDSLKQLDSDYKNNTKHTEQEEQIAESRRNFIKSLSSQTTEVVKPIIKELEQYQKEHKKQ